jgi:hypothetical protein
VRPRDPPRRSILNTRRLKKLRLVGTWQRSVCEPRAVFLAARAMELLGQPRRRPPLPSVTVGRHRRFHRSDMERWLGARRA